MENEHFVHTQVGDDDKTVVGRRSDPMGVGLRLNGCHAVSNILDERCQLAQGTIFLDPDYRNTSTAKIGHEYIFSSSIHRDVAGAGAAGRGCIQQWELAV